MAKECLERKYGWQQQKILFHIGELEKFKPVQNESPKEIKKSVDFLDITVNNLKEVKHEVELGNGAFSCKLLRKLPEGTVAQYHW